MLPHHQYLVKIDGSGRLSRRNRRFLRRFEPASTNISCPPVVDIDQSIGGGAIIPVRPTAHQPIRNDEPESDVQPSHDEDTEAAQDVHCQPERTRLPLMLRRLQPHNKLGLKETPIPPDALYS